MFFRETVSLFLHFMVNPKPPAGFPDVPRCSMTGKEQTVNRFQQIESRWGYSGTSDKIRYLIFITWLCHLKMIFGVGITMSSIHGTTETLGNIFGQHIQLVDVVDSYHENATRNKWYSLPGSPSTYGMEKSKAVTL